MKPASLIDKSIHQLPDLKTLEDYLEQDLNIVLENTFPSQFSVTPSENDGLEAMHQPRRRGNNISQQHNQERLLLMAGKQAVSRIRKEGTEADLSPEEIAGLEAIILVIGRPAIFIQDSSFFRPPYGWEILEQRRIAIENTCRSVGRIEVVGHPNLDWIGTGFLVAENVIMTNRHVAKEFCRLGTRRRWGFEPLIKSSIDYVKELGASEAFEFELTDVIGIHETFDLALFKTSDFSYQSQPTPRPFTLASEVPHHIQGRRVYIIGYPAWDGRRNDPDIMQRIFSNIYGVKRLQPGEVVAVFDEDALFTHDCSTLNGNSGSCLVDIETNKVIGLHFRGRYQQANYAVALWELTSDPLLKKAKVWFD